MTHFATFVRAAWCTTFMLGLASACGGQSFKGGEAGEAGSGGTAHTAGNSNRAGNQATAGSSNSGGSKATAGSSNSGGSAITGGTGSTIDREACTGPSEDNLDGAGCSAYFLRWTHDVATGLCLPTAYGGCGATKNNYETLEACQQACPGGSPNYDTCQVAADCALGSTSCCGVCDGPGVTAHDFIAYNKQYEAQAQQCAAGDVACGACAPVDPQRNTRQYFVPNCVRGECVVEDIRESDVSACTTTDDCRLRNGTGCCEGCGTSDLVAVRNDGSLTKLVCGELIPPCAACEPQPPEGAAALCSSRGHCIVNHIIKD